MVTTRKLKITETDSEEKQQRTPTPTPPRRSQRISSGSSGERTPPKKKQKVAKNAEETGKGKMENRKVVKGSVEGAGEGNKKDERKKAVEDSRRNEGGNDNKEDEEEKATAVGEVISVSGKGKERRKHFEAFEYDGNEFKLEDSVMVVPEEMGQKPYVAVIKDIFQPTEGSIMVLGQWLYRPGEAEITVGERWEPCDARELYYSLHRDEIPAETIMHKCTVHFIPVHKQLPSRKEQPGFVVRNVYDTAQKRLWSLTDNDFEDDKQHEIDLLIQQTLSRLGDLPDVVMKESGTAQEHQVKSKKPMGKNVSRLEEKTGANQQLQESGTKQDHQLKSKKPMGKNVSRLEEKTGANQQLQESGTEQDHQLKSKKPMGKNVSRLEEKTGANQQLQVSGTEQEHQVKSKNPMGKNVSRLEKKTGANQQLQKTGANQQLQETPGSGSDNASDYHAILANFEALSGVSLRDRWLEKLLQAVQHACDRDFTTGSDNVNIVPLQWPDFAVRAVYDLEKTAHATFSADSHKYNQKMRSLVFNLQKNAILAIRLLSGELAASRILNMSPNELKEGLTAEETATEEPDEAEHMQMTDARCSRCNKFKVGLRDVIKAGNRDRYQLECTECGKAWYTSRDEYLMMTREEPSPIRTVDNTPSTSKSGEAEKKWASPCKSDKTAG